jgi:hypothetical protein
MSMALASGKMSLRDLQTFYGVEDLYNMIDIMVVDAHNARVWSAHHAKSK